MMEITVVKVQDEQIKDNFICRFIKSVLLDNIDSDENKDRA